MPEMDGYEVCTKLKSDPATKDIPVIFITAKIDDDSIEKAYEVGGSDYITKPFRPKEVLARVKMQLQIKKYEDELKLLASTDPITKLYNRRYFSQISAHSLDLAKRENKDISLIMLDIDKFKNVNDTYGHKVGDDVIIALANQLIKNQRKSDISCRFGGEEFVVLLSNTSLNGAKILAEKLREAIESLQISIADNQIVKFTVSLGISQIDIKNEINIEAGLKRADDALYVAKESGRNKTCSK
jgi:diguanylate cyclase (GGDEF)-like protein